MQTNKLIQRLKAECDNTVGGTDLILLREDFVKSLIAALQTKEFEEKSDEEASYDYANSVENKELQIKFGDCFISYFRGRQSIRSTELAAALQQIEEKEKRIDELITRNTLAYKSGYDAATSDANQQIEEIKKERELLRSTATTQIAEVKKTTEALQFCESQQKEKTALMGEMVEALELIRDSRTLAPQGMYISMVYDILTKYNQSK